MRKPSNACIHTIGLSLIRNASICSDRWIGLPMWIGFQRRIWNYPLRIPESLLDSIEDMELFSLLHTVDKLTLEILFMKMDGYSSKNEIASDF